MKIKLQSSILVKPAEPTPNQSLPLSELDMVSGNYFVPLIYIYKPSKDRSYTSIFDTFQMSLRKVLVPFYPLAGRLSFAGGGGNLQIDCNGKGVELTEAIADSAWDEVKETDYADLIPAVDAAADFPELPLLAVRITAFNGGGICLGVRMWHPAADGLSGSHFYAEWARIARGETLESHPFIDRKLYSAPAAAAPPPPPEFEKPPILIGDSGCEKEMKIPISKAFLRLSKPQIETLKKSANEKRGSCRGGFSRFESITAHIWRCTCKARGHKPHQKTRLTTSVDIRRRVDPPLPRTYFGNAVVDVAAVDCAGDLTSKPLSYAAGRIREAVSKVTPDYINTTVNFLKSVVGSSSAVDDSLVFTGNPNLTVTSWLSLELNGLDFGWGKEAYMAHVSENCDGDFVVMPDDEHNDDDDDEEKNRHRSVVVAVCLQEAHMEHFKKIFYQDIIQV
ncbi:spermidine hydroxycinnamoyl transferase-like [Andrographis paniculata]|uniref:spermidine hydroxycinnamoyl transferase-like n=1 Tax=Andrographis paniculata TaxID=175694 RepID=UPI0021E86EDC|nr:spermidine hydroxycinnamoyl transferase-like [Andrographis paniculata]